MENSLFKFVSLCYHYVRPKRTEDVFPSLLGNTADQFREHLAMFRKEYELIPLDAVRMLYKEHKAKPPAKTGLLLTFDDGLSDHWRAAEILAEQGIKAVFFIPTCIFEERLPANPIIIHYVLAHHRIGGFLKAYRHALEEFGFDVASLDVPFAKGKDNPGETIAKIKGRFRSSFGYNDARKILLHVYQSTMLRDFPDAISIMHLTPKQTQDILSMGHAIGVHTSTHVSIGATNLTEKEFQMEVIEPKNILETMFDTEIFAFSYPYGLREDCLPFEQFINKTKIYDLAFTIEKIANTQKQSPYELGRYTVLAKDGVEDLNHILNTMLRGGGNTWEYSHMLPSPRK